MMMMMMMMMMMTVVSMMMKGGKVLLPIQLSSFPVSISVTAPISP